MVISAIIPEVVYHYDPLEREAWVRGEKSGFPFDPRLAHCVYKDAQHYYGETWVCRKLIQSGCVCWQELYEMFKMPTEGDEPRNLYTNEIDLLLRRDLDRDVMTELRGLPDRCLDHKCKNPDVIAYDMRSKGWQFYEVKLNNDPIRPGQLESLALLQRFIGAKTGLVRLLPRGTTRTPQEHQLRISLT